MIGPKKFKENLTVATEVLKNGTEAIGMDQNGIAKQIPIEILMTKHNVGLGNVENLAPADMPISTEAQGAFEELDTRINVLERGLSLESWDDLRSIVRLGLAPKYFVPGDQLMATWNGVPRVWDVIGIDHETPANTSLTHSLTIQSRDVMRYSCRFDAPQAIYGSNTELPAGTHVFELAGVKYEVTTTVAMPAGGVLVGEGWTDYVPTAITVYDADRATALESDLTVTTSTATITLTEVNDHVRCRYGSNRYIHSAYRQWLNSNEATFAWQPRGLYDMPSSYETSGFLKLLDPELLAVLGAVNKQVAKAGIDGGGQDLFTDKVFPLSRLEMGYGVEGDTTGESVYPFWDGATNAERIKLQGTTARYWWLRSPLVGYSNHARYVNPSGVLHNYYAHYGYGLAPACVIV